MAQSDNSTALIIGGSTGIGRATAERLLKRGIAVHLVARDQGRLAKAEAELSEHGPVQTSSVDLYDTAAVDRFASGLRDSGAPIRYLVNAAGCFCPQAFSEHSR